MASLKKSEHSYEPFPTLPRLNNIGADEPHLKKFIWEVSQMSITKKLSVSLIAAAVLATGFGSVNQASAAGLSREEAAILAGAGGFVLGAIVGSHGHRRHSRVVYVDSWDAHVSRCLARYRSYDPHSDTYIGYDGYERRCRL
jgi:BA14K-like protein